MKAQNFSGAVCVLVAWFLTLFQLHVLIRNPLGLLLVLLPDLLSRPPVTTAEQRSPSLQVNDACWFIHRFDIDRL